MDRVALVVQYMMRQRYDEAAVQLCEDMALAHRLLSRRHGSVHGVDLGSHQVDGFKVEECEEEADQACEGVMVRSVQGVRDYIYA